LTSLFGHENITKKVQNTKISTTSDNNTKKDALDFKLSSILTDINSKVESLSGTSSSSHSRSSTTSLTTSTISQNISNSKSSINHGQILKKDVQNTESTKVFPIFQQYTKGNSSKFKPNLSTSKIPNGSNDIIEISSEEEDGNGNGDGSKYEETTFNSKKSHSKSLSGKRAVDAELSRPSFTKKKGRIISDSSSEEEEEDEYKENSDSPTPDSPPSSSLGNERKRTSRASAQTVKSYALSDDDDDDEDYK